MYWRSRQPVEEATESMCMQADEHFKHVLWACYDTDIVRGTLVAFSFVYSQKTCYFTANFAIFVALKFAKVRHVH